MSTPARLPADDSVQHPAGRPRDNILKWRPRVPERQGEESEYPLWSMHKHALRIDCRLQWTGEEDWQAVFLVNGYWLFSCRFRSWALAVSAADDKHADLVASGWTPSAGCLEPVS